MGGGGKKKVNNNVKKEVIKILLLGSGESGKSTFFQQLRFMNNAFPKDEIIVYKSVIYANLILTMGVLYGNLKIQEKNLDNSKNEEKGVKILEIMEKESSQLLLDALKIYTDEIHKMVSDLWDEKQIKELFYKYKSAFHIFDGAEYFLNQMNRLTPSKFTPEFKDIIHCRKKTTGVVECKFQGENGQQFKMVDVGGQRSERKKWMNCFEGVKAVVFVSALSDYDLTCYEDNETNRLKESLTVFDDIVNGNWFKDKTIFLIFNKLDIFRSKLKSSPLKNYFNSYEGGDDEDKAIEFIKNLFLEKNKFAQDRIHVFISIATDKDSITNCIKKMTEIMKEA